MQSLRDRLTEQDQDLEPRTSTPRAAQELEPDAQRAGEKQGARTWPVQNSLSSFSRIYAGKRKYVVQLYIYLVHKEYFIL